MRRRRLGIKTASALSAAGNQQPGGAAPARWQSGYAEDCKSLYVGSIPARASIFAMTYDQKAHAEPYVPSWDAFLPKVQKKSNDYNRLYQMMIGNSRCGVIYKSGPKVVPNEKRGGKMAKIGDIKSIGIGFGFSSHIQ